MADVEMSDAPPAAKSSNAGAEGAVEGKKRFEVKKVRNYPRRARVHRSKALTQTFSGMLLRSGRGTLSSTTVPSAVIISWTFASNVKPIKRRQRARSAPSHGVSAMFVLLLVLHLVQIVLTADIARVPLSLHLEMA